MSHHPCEPDYSYRTPDDTFTCTDCGQGWLFVRGEVAQTLRHGRAIDGRWVKAGRS